MEEAKAVEEFLAHRRVALVGASRDPRSFSRALLRELKRRGYDVVPVNPLGGAPVDGLACVRNVKEIDPPVEAAILVTPPAVTEQVVRDCALAGIHHVWMHRGAGVGAASPAALAWCRDNGLEAIEGLCPFMCLPETGFVHRAHRWCRQHLPRRHRRPAAGAQAALRP